MLCSDSLLAIYFSIQLELQFLISGMKHVEITKEVIMVLSVHSKEAIFREVKFTMFSSFYNCISL